MTSSPWEERKEDRRKSRRYVYYSCNPHHYKPFIVERLKKFNKHCRDFDNQVDENPDNYYWDFTRETPAEHRHEKVEGRWTLKSNEMFICGFTLRESGNCCGSVTIHNIIVHQPFNHKRLGILELLMATIEDLAIAQSTSNIMMLNPIEFYFTSTLNQKFNYQIIDRFKNENTGRIVAILSKTLEYKPNTPIIIKEHYND